MSFEQLQETILSQAKAKVEKIERRYAQQRHDEEKRITQQARQAEESIIEAAQVRGDREAARVQQERQLAAKSAVLEAKQKELAIAQEKAVERVLAQSSEETEELLKSLMQYVPKDKGVLIPGERHRAALEKILPGTVELSEEEIPEDGGFIYRSRQTEINLTVRNLLNLVFERHRADLAKILFT